MANCTVCNGAKGKHEHPFMRFLDASILDKDGNTVAIGEYGYAAHTIWRDCSSCDGRGTFPDFDGPAIDAVVAAIMVSRGPRKGQLKASRPKFANTVAARRAYYVWRLARFHGGKDVCMPMGAEMDVRGDGERDKLELMSRVVAKRAFGSASVGSARWRNAMTGNHEVPEDCVDICGAILPKST